MIDRFPGLAALPRARFVGGATPVERSRAAPALWVKRDDRSADPIGGNKVRALEFLLGDVGRGDEVVTVGATGSTHALATAVWAGTLGARATVFRWPQEMNAAARRVDVRLRQTASVRDSRWTGAAYLRAALHRFRSSARWIPAGGTAPLGILGHVDGALELVAQVNAGMLPSPSRVVVALGSGGTAAGLLLGFGIAGLQTEVVGVQVVPRLVANAIRVRSLAARTRTLIEAVSGAQVPTGSMVRFSVEKAQYGGAYGRETEAGRTASQRYREAHDGAMLDATYTAKACAAALACSDDRPTLLWVTFDGRILS